MQPRMGLNRSIDRAEAVYSGPTFMLLRCEFNLAIQCLLFPTVGAQDRQLLVRVEINIGEVSNLSLLKM